MNYRILLKACGLFSLFIGCNMVFPLFWGMYFREELLGFSLSILICGMIGFLFLYFGRRAQERILKKEALAMVGISWILAAGLGALPYYFSGHVSSFLDCYFESMSGFTTTGASILSNIEALPKSLLYWRSYTNWLGGMGIVVLFIAVVPFFSSIGKKIFKSEVPGPFKEGFSPKIKDTALILTGLYILITLCQIFLLQLGGMDLFNALCHTFGTIATGGFSPKNASISHYGSAYIQTVIIAFMLIAGINFSMYYGVLKGKFRLIFTNTELLVYLGIIASACGLMLFDCLNHGIFDSFLTAFRHVAFQTVSILTTTGFVTTDFDAWPHFSRIILVILMFVGGCAGSTAGGIKIIRTIILVKYAFKEISHYFSPKYRSSIKVGTSRIDDNVGSLVMAYFIMVVMVFVAASAAMALTGLDIITAMSSVAATLNNIGPGLGGVGPMENYGFIHPCGKIILIICMILGRLEYFSIIILFLPLLWKRYS